MPEALKNAYKLTSLGVLYKHVNKYFSLRWTENELMLVTIIMIIEVSHKM